MRFCLKKKIILINIPKDTNIPRKLLEHTDVKIYEKATFEEALKIALNLVEKKAVDAIIAPSGTASILVKYVRVPIVRADYSYFDLLETILLTEKKYGLLNKRIAAILHDTRKIDASRLQPFLKNRLSFFTYHSIENDMENLVYNISKIGFDAIVCGPTANSIAKQIGLSSQIIRFGEDTVGGAISIALDFLRFSQKDQEHSQRLRTVLNLFPEGILTTDNKGLIVDFNTKALKIFNINKEQIFNMKIQELTNEQNWEDIYEKGIQHNDRFLKLPHINLFTSAKPIILDNEVQGSVVTLQEASKIERLEHQYRKYKVQGLTAKYNFKDIIGVSPLIKRTIETAKAFSHVDSTILIEGKTGTGKEIFAQSIHNNSSRRNGPFVAINCAALPDNLLESELMGYEEGAFTGAKKGGKTGLFELAHKGTIFLDEINQIPIHLQSRILRVLQEKQVLRLGSEKMVSIDVRIIAATNQDLNELIQAGQFREDLFYRLCVLNIKLPCLHERKDDISLLIDYYFRKFTEQYGPVTPFSNEAIQLLSDYSWPGNIRELINLVERYVVVNKQLEISSVDFVNNFLSLNLKNFIQDNNYNGSESFRINFGTLNEMEGQLIKEVLDKFDGNKVKTSQALGINRTTLWKKLKYIEEDECPNVAFNL